jgi:tetratricopeptide (TPR) repeat protein
MLHPKHADDSLSAQRFLDEARITGQLQHPGIPAVHQIGTLADGRPFLAMKLIKGLTLAKIIENRQRRPMPATGAGEFAEPSTLAIMEAVCQAVGYAHAHGVIHRDLKPSNVMIGAFGEVQVMDWGLAKLLTAADTAIPPRDTDPDSVVRSPRDSDLHTQAGSILGTPAFMSPEQAIGAIHRIDERSDVFSLGAILFVMLTGHPLYDGVNPEAIRYRAACADLDEAFSRLDGCGAEPDLVALVKRCLARQREDRPRDGRELAHSVAMLRTAADERARLADMERAKAEVRESEQRKRRRSLQFAGGALIAMLICAVVSAVIGAFRAESARVAEFRRAEAEARRAATEAQAKEDAEKARDAMALRTRFALDAFNDMVFAIQNKLRVRPETQDLRRELLHNARAGLQRILDEAREQGSPDSTLVWSHFRMGDLEENLGSLRAAQREYQAACDMAQRLIDANPANAVARRDLSVGLNNLGDIAVKLGKTNDALGYFEQALQIRHDLAAGDPNGELAQRDLSISFGKLGSAMLRHGRTKEALDYFQKRLVIDQRIANAHPENLADQRDLSLCFHRLGDVMHRMGQSNNALSYYHKSLAIVEKLAASNAQDTQAQRELSIGYDCIAGVMRDQGRLNEALDLLKKSSEILQRLAEADPRNIEAQRDLAVSYRQLATNFGRLGQPNDALEYTRKIVPLRERLVSTDPNNAQFRRDLSVAYIDHGDVLRQQGQSKDALALFEKALEIRQRLADADPKDTSAAHDLSIGLERIGNALLREGRPQDARDYLQKKLAIDEKLAEADPTNLLIQRDLSIAHSKLGDTFRQLKQFSEARASHRNALQIRQRLVDADPANADAQLDLFVSCHRLGSIDKSTHDFAQAEQWFAKGRAILQPLHDKKQLFGQFKNAVADMDREIAFCRNAELAVARLDHAFTRPASEIADLLGVRVKALLQRNEVPAAVTSAQRFADWAMKQDQARGSQCYRAAAALALCAADEKHRDAMIARCVELLAAAHAAGFLNSERIGRLKLDKDFAAVNRHPAWVKFVEGLQPKPK